MVGRARRLAAVGAGILLVTGVAFLSNAAAVPSEVRLHLGSDGKSFTYGTTVQNLTTASGTCVINSAEPVMDLSSSGAQTEPGLPADSIGVKRRPSSANGTPCGQVDGPEVLRLTPGSALGGRLFTGLRLDLEMTGNAVVQLTLSRGTTSALYQLQTGTSIAPAQSSEPGYDTVAPYVVSSSPGDEVDGCAAPNSSGPNSTSNDNCQWAVTPGFDFNTISIATTLGTVALEGSNDFGNNPAFDTLFYLGNSAPDANDDTVVTNEDTAVSGNVLTNDTDVDGNPLTATKLTDPAHGTVTLSSAGAFTYTPSANYFGSDSFTYSASDGTASSTATVNITVTSVNDVPTAANDTAEVDEDASVTISVLANDSDIDGDALQVTSIAAVTPSGSSVVVNADNTVSYSPPADYTGSASFTYRASDGTASSNAATVSITVVPVMCSLDTVSDTDGATSGSFTRLSDPFECKRYTVTASNTDHTVLFQPTGDSTVKYRGVVSFGPEPPPTPGGSGEFVLLLRYDPAGGTNFRPVRWCSAMQFDSGGKVTAATLPAGETWCVASEGTRGDANGDLETFWQVYGEDDPNFIRR